MKYIKKIYFVDTLNVNKKNYIPLYANGSFVLGQEYDGKAIKEDFDPVFDPLQSFSGKMTQVEIWNIVLTSTEIQKLANCDVSTTKSQNHILTWKTEDWKLSGQTTISDIPFKELCKENIISNQFIWPRATTFKQISHYCSLIDGVPPLVYKNAQIKEVYNEVRELFITVNKTMPSGFLDRTRKVEIRCFISKYNSHLDYWSGMKWNKDEKKWYSPLKPLEDFSKFKQEIREDGYNCAFMKENSFISVPCNKNFPCGICSIPHQKYIYLKGLCKTGYDIFDMKYYVYGLRNNRPYFK